MSRLLCAAQRCYHCTGETRNHSAFALSEGSLVPELLIRVTAASPEAAVSSTVAAGLQTDFEASVMPACGLSLSASCKSLYSQKQFNAVSTPKTETPANAQICATTFLRLHNQQGRAELCSTAGQQQDAHRLLTTSQLTCHSCPEDL